MDEPRRGTALTVSVCVNATLTGAFESVNDLERAVIEATRAAGRQLYAQSFAAFQSAWLQSRRQRFSAQRWRSIDWLTPFGPVAVPLRVVREKLSGKYFSLSKVLFGAKATRRLCPALEQHATAEACAQNYRPAAGSLSRWIGQRVGHWLVWACVQFHGARRLLELQKLSPSPGPGMNVPVLISELDSTWLKSQVRHRTAKTARHFPVHLGLHYSGRSRRYARRGSRSVRLENKSLLASTAPLTHFGRSFQLLGLRRFCPRHHVLLSDGDEGLEWLREKYFPQATWLLDRWHIAQAVRALVATDQAEYRRLMAAVWQADSEAVLQALRQSPLRRRRPKEFGELFGYVLGNREGIDAWQRIPAALRRSAGRSAAAVKCGSGAVEKNIEVAINRRFKRQGRSWNRQRAEHLLQLKLLCADERRWTHWWKAKPKFITKPNPP
jgi:hypothetical protein